MEVKNACTVPEPQTHRSHEAADPTGILSAAGTEAGKGDGASPGSSAELGSLPEGPPGSRREGKPAPEPGCPPAPSPTVSPLPCPFPPRFPGARPALPRAPRQPAHGKGPAGSTAAISSAGDGSSRRGILYILLPRCHH